MWPTIPFNIALVEPEIPPNTGSIARLCGATGTILHLIEPLGFRTDDRSLKRAGLDYWKHVTIQYWQGLDVFLDQTASKRRFFLSKKATRSYTEARFAPGDFLIFGKETLGLPEDILDAHAESCYVIPMASPHIRSLNLAMSAGIVLYEALRQQKVA